MKIQWHNIWRVIAHHYHYRETILMITPHHLMTSIDTGVDFVTLISIFLENHDSSTDICFKLRIHLRALEFGVATTTTKNSVCPRKSAEPCWDGLDKGTGHICTSHLKQHVTVHDGSIVLLIAEIKGPVNGTNNRINPDSAFQVTESHQVNPLQVLCHHHCVPP